MFHKFKMTAYATLLLITVLVLPYAGIVAEVSAVNYNCSGSKKEVRQCLKAVISERDKTIEELQAGSSEQGDLEAQLDAAMSKIGTFTEWQIKLDRLKEVQMVKDEAKRAQNVAERQACEDKGSIVCERPDRGAGEFHCRSKGMFQVIAKGVGKGDGCKE